MEKLKGTKCGLGYIAKQKKFQSLMLLVFIAVGIGLFFTGYLITGTRANVFTVLGILMVLPGAKRVIALVVMVPRRSVEVERYERMMQTVDGKGEVLTDYVFTSPDKIMGLDFVVVQNHNVLGILDGKKQDVKYITEYLKKGVGDTVSGYQVRIFSSDEEFYAFYKKMNQEIREEGQAAAKQEEVIRYLKVLAV